MSVIEDRLREKFENSTLNLLAFITDGQHGYHEVDDSSEISHLTAKNAKNWFADREGADRLAKWVDDNNKRSSLQENDIILSTRGSVGYCAIVKGDVLPANIDQDVARIALNADNDILPEFLLAYLNSKVGQDWMLRNSSGMVQQGLPLSRVRDLPLPIMSDSFQGSIKQIVNSAFDAKQTSQASYQEAENILLEHLGLKYWQPSEAGVSVKSSSEAFGAERLDPEFYQPKFDELEAIIAAKEKVRPLGEFLVVNARGKQPSYEDDGVLVVNSKHVRTGKVIITDNRRAMLEKGALTIRKGDVLINGTGVGTIGRCAPYLHDEVALPDNHVTVLRTNELDPVYLSVYLNSPAGQLQVDKHYKGSSGQIELYPDQIANFYVWKAPTEVQEQIREKVEASYEAEQLSEQLLDHAKRGVELAIEESEATALAWIEERMSDLGFGDDASR